MAKKSVLHLGLNREELDGATLAIIPGDPDRVPRIAEHLDHVESLGQRREFVSYRGYLAGKPVVVCSTGIGGPSASICVEELAQLGVKTFLRVGTTGTIQKHIQLGDLIIVQAAVRLDGASQHFAPVEFPAVAHYEVVNAFIGAARERDCRYHVGIAVASDTFYPGQERYDTFSGWVPRRFRGSLQDWQKMGVLSYEMETAALFTMCQIMGLRVGCIAGVIAHRVNSEHVKEHIVEETENRAITATLTAAKKLLGQST